MSKFGAVCLTLLLVAPVPRSAAQVPPGKSSAKTASASTPAEAELARRIREADAARATKDPETIARANRHLSALALREMGQLRLLQLAYPQAIELYRSSLDFDDLPDIRVGLAIAELDAKQLDDAIAESKKALTAAPNDVPEPAATASRSMPGSKSLPAG